MVKKLTKFQLKVTIIARHRDEKWKKAKKIILLKTLNIVCYFLFFTEKLELLFKQVHPKFHFFVNAKERTIQGRLKIVLLLIRIALHLQPIHLHSVSQVLVSVKSLFYRQVS